MSESDFTAPSVLVANSPTGIDVLRHLGWPTSDPESLALAQAHVNTATALAHSYTRGRGFHPTGPYCAAGIASAIERASARSMTNATDDRQTTAGSLQAQPGTFTGWSIAEREALDMWRTRVV